MKSRIDRFKIINLVIFSIVIEKITLYIIENVNFKWIVIKQLIEKRNKFNYNLFVDLCNYEILIKYLLFRACNEEFFIFFIIVLFSLINKRRFYIQKINILLW